MFVFDNVLTAGTVLVRQQIESQNWESSGHTAGWFIGADGNASFFTVTLHGDLVSANYVANTSGYKLTYATGDAEVNQLTSRGTLHVGPASGQRLDLKVTTGIPRMELWSGDASEATPAFVATDDSNVGFPALRLDSVDVGKGVTELQVISPDPTGNNPGKVFIGGTNSTPAGIPATIFELANAVTISSNNVHGVSLTSVNHAFQIGPTLGVNLAMDSDEIAARNTNAASLLNLNKDGGNVQIGGGAAAGSFLIGPSAGAHLIANFNQLWALNGAAASDLFLNFSSAGNVQIGDGTTTGAALKCVPMRAVEAVNTTGATTTSTTFVTVTVNWAPATFTFPYPPSGVIAVSISARINTATAGQRALMAVQINDTNSAGTLRHAMADSEAIESASTTVESFGRTIVISGLPTSGVGYATIGIRTTNAAAGATVDNMRIVVQPMP